MQFFKQLTDPALKRLYKFVLKRMIGRYLADDEIDLDQLDVHLGSGKLELCDLTLNAEILNKEICEAFALPFRIKSGYIGSVRVIISYAKIMSESCLVEIDDVDIILVPVGKENINNDTPQTTPAMKSSSQHAQASESVKATSSVEPTDEVSQEGLDFVASWIEQVTSKIKVSLSNFSLRLETPSVGLLCRLEWCQLSDESANDVQSVYGSYSNGASVNLNASVSNMNSMTMFGVTQKGIKCRGFTMELLTLGSGSSAQLPQFHHSRKFIEAENQEWDSHPFLATPSSQECYMQIKTSAFEALRAPAIDAQIFFHSIQVVLQPKHFPEFSSLIDGFSIKENSSRTRQDTNRTFGDPMKYESICESKPAWLLKNESDNRGKQHYDPGVNLTLREFQRIEELLHQYRQTHHNLQRSALIDQRATGTGQNYDQTMLTSRLSTADSVESCGMSDLELEEDQEEEDFFECKSGRDTISFSNSHAASALLSKSIYESALPGYGSMNLNDSRQELGSSMADIHLPQRTEQNNINHSRRVVSRIKLHILEVGVIILYDDLVDDDCGKPVSQLDDDETEPISPTTYSYLPNFDGLERLEFKLNDILCSSIVQMNNLSLSLSIGNVLLNEKIFPRLSLGMSEDEINMITVPIVSFKNGVSETENPKHTMSDFKARIQVEFPNGEIVEGISIICNVQPILIEWDMFLLDRAHQLVKLLEASADQESSPPNSSLASTNNIQKRLELNTEYIDIILRFPMVNSDLIRFGPSSNRGLCEDCLIVRIEKVQLSTDLQENDVDGKTSAKQYGLNELTLPWLSEFNILFKNLRITLRSPKNAIQSSSDIFDHILMLGYSDDAVSQTCYVRFRIQSPTIADIKDAISSRNKLIEDSEDISSHSADSTNHHDFISGEDNDGGRVGWNSWSKDAEHRSRKYENASSKASQFNMHIAIPISKIDVQKSVLNRLMILFDALLMINPIDIDAYNQQKALLNSKLVLTPNYMSVTIKLQRGTLKLCDFEEASLQNSADIDNTVNHSTENKTLSLVTFYAAYEQVRVFQLMQWMGELMSRSHIYAHDLTLLEQVGESKPVPVIYKTPYGKTTAPAIYMALDITDQSQDMREMKIEVHCSHLTLRHDATSKWLFCLIDILLLEYPPPIIPLDSANLEPSETILLHEKAKSGNYHVVPLATSSKTIFTKLLVNLYDSVVDVAPPETKSRVILVFGNVTISSNVITGARIQGFKFAVKDIELFLTPYRTPYDRIDPSILGNELYMGKKTERATRTDGSLKLRREELLTLYSSLHAYLEKDGFLQIMTMDFADVFLRSVIPNQVALGDSNSASDSPELSVELNLGTANIYACFDSFNTLIEVFSKWADQLVIEQELPDTTAYVGLDHKNKSTGLSVITNLKSGAINTTTIGTNSDIGKTSYSAAYPKIGDLSEPKFSSSIRTASLGEPRILQTEVAHDNGDNGKGTSINIFAQVDEYAFGNTKRSLPASLPTDTEARLLRTRLDELQKQKDRMSTIRQTNDITGNQFSSSINSSLYNVSPQRKPALHLSDIVIDDYYARSESSKTVSTSISFSSTDAQRKQKQKPFSIQAQNVESPWFTEIPEGGRENLSSERSSSPSDETIADRIIGYEQKPEVLSADTLKQEAIHQTHQTDRIPYINYLLADTHLGLHESKSVNKIQKNEEPSQVNLFTNQPDRLQARSKDFNYSQSLRNNDMHSHETDLTSSQLHDLGSGSYIQSLGVTEDLIFNQRMKAESLNGLDENLTEHTDDSLSLSVIYSEGGEETEVELDFTGTGNLRYGIAGMTDADTIDEESEENLLSLDQLPITTHEDYPTSANEHDIFDTESDVANHLESNEDVPLTLDVSIEDATARWFGGDENTSSAGSPPRIYPYHVEIPIGGAAASLSFGEKELNEAKRSVVNSKADSQSSVTSPITIQHVLLRNLNICVRFFGGNDWVVDYDINSSNDQKISSLAQSKAKSNIVPSGNAPVQSRKGMLLDTLLDDYIPSQGNSLFDNVVDSPQSARQNSTMNANPTVTQRSSIKSGRKTDEMLELMVKRIQLRLDVFNSSNDQPLVTNTVLALGDFEILDYISTSQIRKIICYWKSDVAHPRETGSNMVHVHLITILPGPNLCEEHRLKVRLLPLRINLDQEVVEFLRQFIPAEDPTVRKRIQRNGQDSSERSNDEGSIKSVSTPLQSNETEMSYLNTQPNLNEEPSVVSLGGWFFQSVDIPPCKIKIDYRPTHVNYGALRSGDYLEVLNLFVLEGMELVLRRVKLAGVDGWGALSEHVIVSWVNDISRRQIHKCIASVSMPPLRSIANVGSGAADLILLPMEHYGKDRRVVRGIKKGASSFLKAVTIETLNTASKIARGTQTILEHADDVVSSNSVARRKRLKFRQRGSRIMRNSKGMGGGGIRLAQESGGGIGSKQYLAPQPSNASEGISQAYDSLSREFHVAAKTIVAVPLVEYRKTGSQGYVRSVIRAVPVAVLRPMIGATEAISKTLIGVRNGFDPELKEDIENKFKDFSTY